MLRIAVQAKGRLFEETMALLEESDIKLSTTKRTLLVQSSNFPIEVLFLRDDDIPQTVATGVADLGVVGENEFMEKEEDAEIIKRLGFSKCRLSLAMPKDLEYPGLSWFNGKKIATSYPVILRNFLREKGVNAEIHVITGSVEVSPGIGLADAIFDIVSSGSTLVSNRLKEVEVVMKSEALLIGNKNMSDEKKEVLNEFLFRMNAVKTAEDKKYVLMNAPKDKLEEIIAVLPGMKSPTVMPLAQEGWCSVHTVLDEKRFWEKFEPQQKRTSGIIDLLCENTGRENFGTGLENQRKGISGGVKINDHRHFGFEIYPLPLDERQIAALDFGIGYIENTPAFYRFELDIDEPCDTFLDTDGFGKGCAFVNGFNIGRFWEIGPQKRLYIPAPLLQIGKNTIVIFETEGKAADSIFLAGEHRLF